MTSRTQHMHPAALACASITLGVATRALRRRREKAPALRLSQTAGKRPVLGWWQEQGSGSRHSHAGSYSKSSSAMHVA